jgi:hypothetical protein
MWYNFEIPIYTADISPIINIREPIAPNKCMGLFQSAKETK